MLGAESPKDLLPRERAFQLLVDGMHVHDEARRGDLVRRAMGALDAREIYEANMVISLFNFYNKWIDLNGVATLTAEGYAASGKRLAQNGYLTRR